MNKKLTMPNQAQLKKLLSYLTILLILVLSFNQIEASTTIKKPHVLVTGNLIQGGVLFIETPQNAKLFINGTQQRLYKGQAIYGIARQQHKINIKLIFKNKTYKKSLNVSAKKYGEQRITVKKKYVEPPKKVYDRIIKDVKLAKDARKIYSKLDKMQKYFDKPAKGIISGVYGTKRFFNNVPKRPHLGLDIAAKTSTPVYAPADGKVVLNADLYYSGNTIFIDHGLGLKSSYLHLHKSFVKPNQKVKKGDLIAEIGSTGRSTGPHLHWGMSVMNTRVDPEEVLHKSYPTLWSKTFN